MTRQHILRAIEEYDDRGRDAFLGVYGFTPAPGATLTHEGRTYDARAILGVAHRYATGRVATSEEFHDGAAGAAALLRKRGFHASGSEPAGATSSRTTTARRTSQRSASPRSAPRRAAAEEEPPAVCPTCFMALPATGVCDTCG
ncbi:hypothetical protein [Isoptericola variabilis]|uniref:hypothetical protein n=1 Tax=Isoptericola variabilis TaxID=139208 RepID=UPI001E2D0050|nr:hypothetical protein [Isoptericola variabilis]